MSKTLERKCRKEYISDTKNQVVEQFQALNERMLLVIIKEDNRQKTISIIDRQESMPKTYGATETYKNLQNLDINKILKGSEGSPYQNNQKKTYIKPLDRDLTDIDQKIIDLKKLHSRLIEKLSDTVGDRAAIFTSIEHLKIEIAHCTEEVERLIREVSQNHYINRAHFKSELYRLKSVQTENLDTMAIVDKRTMDLKLKANKMDEKIKNVVRSIGLRQENPKYLGEIEQRVAGYNVESLNIKANCEGAKNNIDTIMNKLPMLINEVTHSGLDNGHFFKSQLLLEQVAKQL